GHELHALPWRDPRPGAHVARAALCFVLEQVEAGHGCPISMTYSVIPALRAQPELAAEWQPRFTSTAYDPRLVPVAHKTGALCGMAMTEKQGGSDVRANTTRAVALAGRGPGAEYELTGHKWFCSAPMSDAFLVLAQAERGLSCFLLPRFLPDGTRNRFHIQRLKDKLGNRSNAWRAPTTTRRSATSPASRRQSSSTGSASVGRCWSPRRSSAWAATATSRNR